MNSQAPVRIAKASSSSSVAILRESEIVMFSRIVVSYCAKS